MYSDCPKEMEMEIPIEFCDYDDGRGNLCNRRVEVEIKKENYNLYLCKRCLYMVDIDPDVDRVVYINQYGGSMHA